MRRNINNDKVQVITENVGCCGRAKGKITGREIKIKGARMPLYTLTRSKGERGRE